MEKYNLQIGDKISLIMVEYLNIFFFNETLLKRGLIS